MPQRVAFSSEGGYQTLFCTFTDAVSWVWPRATDLVSGRTTEYTGKRFGTSGHALFHADGLPTIECANINPSGNIDTRGFPVILDVPQDGWPSGIWFFDLQLRRDETSEWQPLTDEEGGRLPVVLLSPPTAGPDSYRAVCLWRAFGTGLSSEALTDKLPPSTGNEQELCAMLAEVGGWLALGFNEKAWQKVRFLEILFGELARQASWLLLHGGSRLADALLAAAGRENYRNPARSLFVAVPDLFALPAENFCLLSNADPIRASLLWCAELATAPRVADAFQDLILRVHSSPCGRVPGVFRVLQHFKNFAAAVQQHGGHGERTRLRPFRLPAVL